MPLSEHSGDRVPRSDINNSLIVDYDPHSHAGGARSGMRVQPQAPIHSMYEGAATSSAMSHSFKGTSNNNNMTNQQLNGQVLLLNFLR